MRNPFSYRCLILVMGLPWTGFPVLGQGSLPPMTEKIFVQTDRTFYLAGERIWFSIFDLDSQYTAPLSISRVAYLEILDSAHHPLIQTKVALNGGRGNGSLLLPLTLRSGNYLLRCYTAWMKNFPPEDYFSQLLTLVNSTHPGDVRPPEGSRTEGILFVPEGGHLVAGIPARVDFFVSGQDGAMTTGTGVIEGPRGDTVESFQWGREGRGSFVFTPVETGGYKALIQIREGDTMVRALPPVADSGMTLRLDRASLDSLQITVYGTAPGLATLELSLEGKTLWSGSQTIQDHQAEFSVAIARFPPGFYRATVFGPDRQELASTSFFHPSARRLEVHAAADQPSYGNRRKVTITLDTEDPSGTGVSADLSVSVFRIDSLPAFPQTGILNALWMTGRGNYPLGADPDSFPEAMDGRVLPVFQRPETYVPEIHGHIITGKVTDVRTGKAAPGVLAYLSVPGKRIQMEASLSDDSGMVHFDLRDFYGPGEIVAETNFVSDSNYRVEIFSPFSESYDPVHIPRLDLSPEFGPALAERGLSMQVENGYHKDPKQISPHLDTAAFFGKPYKTYMLDDYTRFTTMEEVLREYVSEVGLRLRGRNYHLMVLDNSSFLVQEGGITQKMFTGDPLVLLDGVPVFDMNKIVAEDPLKVQRLDIVADRYYYGPVTAEGIVSFTTYHGDLSGFQLSPFSLEKDYNGLEVPLKFPSPDYGDSVLRASPVPDFRTLLYWNPSYRTDARGAGNLSFYTSDFSGEYLVVINGVSGTGLTGSTSFSFAVEQGETP